MNEAALERMLLMALTCAAVMLCAMMLDTARETGLFVRWFGAWRPLLDQAPLTTLLEGESHAEETERVGAKGADTRATGDPGANWSA